jgi:hypothetical protein
VKEKKEGKGWSEVAVATATIGCCTEKKKGGFVLCSVSYIGHVT